MIAGWDTHSINDCCEILDSQRVPLNAEQRSKIPGDIPYYGANGVQGYINQSLFDEELILMAEDGGNFDQFETRPIAYKISGKSWVNNHAHILKAKNGFNQDFVFYSIVHKNILYFIQGGTRSKLNQSDLKSITLQIPNSETEQSTIATILTTIDQAIERTEQLIFKYERIKTGLMQDLLTRGIDEQGNIRTEETHEFKDSVLGRIPKEWDVVNIGSISEYIGSGVTPKGGSSVYQSSGIMLIRSQNVYPDGFKLEDIAFISEEINNTMLRSEVHENDVLLNITGASIGRCTYIPENFPKANVNQHVCAIRLIGKNHSKAVFLSDFLNSESGQNQIFKYNAGSNREGLNYSQIRGIELRLPQEDDEIERISSILMAYTETLYSLKSEYAKYFALKKALMQDLLTGKVRVDALTNKLNSLNEN